VSPYGYMICILLRTYRMIVWPSNQRFRNCTTLYQLGHLRKIPGCCGIDAADMIDAIHKVPQERDIGSLAYFSVQRRT